MKKFPSLPFFLSVSVLLALADQIAKLALISRFRFGEILPIIPGYLNLTYIRNRGGAFGLLAAIPPAWAQGFFIVATTLALVFVLYLYGWKTPLNRGGRVALILIFGGGLGNLVDRVAYGEVIDFVDVYYGSYHWPAFNLADSCISVGVALLAVDIFRDPGGDPGGGQESG